MGLGAWMQYENQRRGGERKPWHKNIDQAECGNVRIGEHHLPSMMADVAAPPPDDPKKEDKDSEAAESRWIAIEIPAPIDKLGTLMLEFGTVTGVRMNRIYGKALFEHYKGGKQIEVDLDRSEFERLQQLGFKISPPAHQSYTVQW